jgi:hypothetical protein
MDRMWKRDGTLTVKKLLNVTGSFQLGGTTVAATAAELNASAHGLTATAAQINSVANPATRIVKTTATVLALTVTQHADRVVLVNTNSTVANTVTLPAATGSGEKFTIINNITQTQGSVVVTAAGTDVIAGAGFMFASTASGAEAFVTTATSKKVTLNITTTGGLGGDEIDVWDSASGVWTVRVMARGSGTLATPFSA